MFFLDLRPADPDRPYQLFLKTVAKRIPLGDLIGKIFLKSLRQYILHFGFLLTKGKLAWRKISYPVPDVTYSTLYKRAYCLIGQSMGSRIL